MFRKSGRQEEEILYREGESHLKMQTRRFIVISKGSSESDGPRSEWRVQRSALGLTSLFPLSASAKIWRVVRWEIVSSKPQTWGPESTMVNTIPWGADSTHWSQHVDQLGYIARDC